MSAAFSYPHPYYDALREERYDEATREFLSAPSGALAMEIFGICAYRHKGCRGGYRSHCAQTSRHLASVFSGSAVPDALARIPRMVTYRPPAVWREFAGRWDQPSPEKRPNPAWQSAWEAYALKEALDAFRRCHSDLIDARWEEIVMALERRGHSRLR